MTVLQYKRSSRLAVSPAPICPMDMLRFGQTRIRLRIVIALTNRKSACHLFMALTLLESFRTTAPGVYGRT